MLFHKFARDLEFLEIDLFGCKVNKKGGYYILKTDADVLKFLNTLKGGDFVDVCIVHKISDPILVEDITELDPIIQTHGHDSGLNARADVSPPNNDINRTKNGKDKGKRTDINREIKNQMKVKKDAQVNIDEIPYGPVGIDFGFEDMHKKKKGKYQGKLGGDDQYFDSSDLSSECSDDERELVGTDEVRDAPARNLSKKVYFDTSCKKILFELYMIFENVVQFREALQTYSIQKGVNLKLKPNERERVRANCTKKGYPWHILGSIEGSTRNASRNPTWIAKNFKDIIISEPQIKLHQIQALIRKAYGLYVSKTFCKRAKIIVMKENMGDYKKEFARFHDYAEMLKSTNPETTIVIRTSKNVEPGKEGTCKGELLSYIFKDRNNQMYLMAWAVVERESKDTWSWFIRCLKHDLNLTKSEGEGLTVMSDMQKGLYLAITQLLPNAEMRRCARHI
ncbi:uncharacterized protein LOC142178262 [Nicotiana tabacum]|uniref:Uncharacterized protein LOC142178262 n=1 Tax=Nicotiana tabacum TaxID=4097 RepID=A0AC58U2J3_TOBAC